MCSPSLLGINKPATAPAPPAPAAPPPAAPVFGGDLNGLGANRRGTSSLRIDLASGGQLQGGKSGLNIPL